MPAFVGRQQDLEWLQRRLECALAGAGRVVFVTGEAGAGKSALAERFLEEAALRTPEVRIIAAGCSEQYGAGEPYQPFVEAFRDLILESDKPTGTRLREVARQVAPYWLQAIPVAGDIIAATIETAAELKRKFGSAATTAPEGEKPAAGTRLFEVARKVAPYWVQAIPVAGDIITATIETATELKHALGDTATMAPPSEEALFFQYTELLLAAAEERALVLFIDDLHWADNASVALLEHVALAVADKPVLIIATYRPADVEVAKHPIRRARLELERRGLAEELQLAPLDSDALADFIREELGAPPTPELLRWLEDQAGANPLFFGQLLRLLAEQQFVQRRHDEFALVATPDEVEIPRSAESVIEKRLARLDPDVYRVLEYASVEGDEFYSITLAQLLDVDEPQLEEMLEPAVRVHRLVGLSETRRLPNGELTGVYEFSHTLFQDVLHGNLHGKRRILLHRKTAEILENVYGADKTIVAHKLAVHYDEGRSSDRAYDFALLAAERASRVFAHLDAIKLLQRALRNAEADEQTVEALGRLGEEHRLLGHYSEARDNFQDALIRAESQNDRRRIVALRCKTVQVERDHGHWSPSDLHDQLSELAGEARQLGAEAELYEILWSYESLPAAEEGYEAAKAALQEALQIAERLGDTALIARAHQGLAAVLMFGEDPAESIPHGEQAKRTYADLENKGRVGTCHNYLAVVHTVLGSYEQAAREFEAAAAIFDELGDPVNEAAVRNNYGALLIRLGDYERAEENLKEALRLDQRMDAGARLIHPLQNLAELHQAKGEREAARGWWQKLLCLGHEIGYRDAEIVGRCGLGTGALEEGDLASAKAELAVARGLVKDPDAWTESREALELLAAKIQAAGGDKSGAMEALEDAETALASRDRFLWASYRLTRAEYMSGEDPERARAIVRDALEAFEQLGAEPMRRRALELYSRTGGAS